MGEELKTPPEDQFTGPTILDIAGARGSQEDLELRRRQEESKERFAVTRGFLRGIDQTQGLFHGGIGAIRSALGDEVGALRSFEAAQAQFRESEENPSEVALFTEKGQRGAFDTFGDFTTWAGETAGELLPSLASAVVSGIAGGVAGAAVIPGPDPADVVTIPGGAAGGFFTGLFARRALKEVIEEVAESYIKSGMTKELARRQAKKFVTDNADELIAPAIKKLGKRWGSNVGVAGTTAWLEGGGMWVEGVERGIDAPFSAMALGLVSGASEVFLGVGPRIIKRIVGKGGGKTLNQIARKEGPKGAADHLWDTAKTMGAEAFQEFTQEFIATLNLEINDPNFKITDKESFKRWIEAGAKGAVGGFVFGSGAAAVDSITQGLKNRRTLKTLANKESLGQWVEDNPATALELVQFGFNPTNEQLAGIGIPALSDDARKKLVKDVVDITGGVPESGIVEVSDVKGPVSLETGQELDTEAQQGQPAGPARPSAFNRADWPDTENLTEAQSRELRKLRRTITDPDERADLDNYATEAWLIRTDQRGPLSAADRATADSLSAQDPEAAAAFIETALTDPSALPDFEPERTLGDVGFPEFNARAEAAKLPTLRSRRMLETLLAVARQDSTADFSGVSARALIDRGYLERVPQPKIAGRAGRYAVTDQGWATMGVLNPAAAPSPAPTQEPTTSETSEISDAATATTGPATAIPAVPAEGVPGAVTPDAVTPGVVTPADAPQAFPEDLFQRRTAQIEEAFPGSTVTPLEDGRGWTVKLPSGKEIKVEVSADIPVDVPSVMKFYGVSREEAEQIAARGTAGVTVPAGVSLTLATPHPEFGQTVTPSEVMVFLDPRRSNDRTARHEALHVARELGLFDGTEGRKIWAALERKYGSEEAVAAAREEWAGPQSLWKRIRAFFNRLMTKIGATMDVEQAMAATFNPEFWAQIESGIDPAAALDLQVTEDVDAPTQVEGGPSIDPVEPNGRNLAPHDDPKLKFQLGEDTGPIVTDLSVTSIRNDAVDEFRRMREAGQIEALEAESWEQWLEHAARTLDSDPGAAGRFILELEKDARNLSPRESAMLTMIHRGAYNRFEALSDQQFDANAAGEEVRAAQFHNEVLVQLQSIDRIEEVARKTGTLAGQALNARKIALRRDFSFDALARRARVAQGGESLSKEQLDELRALADSVRVLETRLAESESANVDLLNRLDRQLAEEVTKVTRKGKRKAKATAPKSKAFEALKSAWTEAGQTYIDDPATPEGDVPKFQLGEEEGAPREDAPGELEDTAKIRAAADQLADVFVNEGVESFGEFWALVSIHLGGQSRLAESIFREAWSDKSDTPADVSDIAEPAEITRKANAILQRLVENGFRDRDQIVEIIQDVMSDVLPTIRAAREAITAYGQFTLPSQDEVSQIIRDQKDQLLQVVKLDILERAEARAEELKAEGMSDDDIVAQLDREDLMLKATGFLRDNPSDVARRLRAMVNEAKKNIPITTESREGQLKTAMDSTKRTYRNSIRDLEWQIENRERIVKKKGAVRSDAELDALKKRKAELLKEFKEIFPPEGLSSEQREAMAEKNLDRAIAEIERQLEEGDVDVKPKKGPLSNPSLDAKRARLEELRAQRQALRDAKNPKLTPEQRARRVYEANLKRRIAEYEEILANEDFAPKPRKEPRQLSDSEIALKTDLEKKKQEVLEKMEEYRLAHASPMEKAAHYLKQTAHLSRAFMTSIDLSATFRQGGLAIFSHPTLGLQSAKKMTKALLSKEAERQSIEEMKNDPLFQWAMTVGLAITEEDGKITRQEEVFQGQWAKKFPLVAASGRAYSTMLNNLRFGMLKIMVENLGRDGQVTKDEGRVIARYINALTGRADLKALNKLAANLNTIFFAPRWVASRFQYLAMPLWMYATRSEGNAIFNDPGNTKRVRKLILKEYARSMTGMAVVIGSLITFLSIMSDEEDEVTLEMNPVSSDFMKIKVGETRLDPTAGLSSVVTFSSRMIAQRYKGADGEIKTFGEGFKPTTRATTFGRYLRYKMAPMPGAVWTAFDDFTDPVGNEVTPWGLAARLFIPLSVGEVRDAMSNQNVPTGTAMSFLALLGMSASTYGEETEYSAANMEERTEILNKKLKTIEWDDPQVGYSHRLTPDQLQQLDDARKRNAGLRVFQFTNPGSDAEFKQKARDALEGYPGDSGEALRFYLKTRGMKATSKRLRKLKELDR